MPTAWLVSRVVVCVHDLAAEKVWTASCSTGGATGRSADRHFLDVF